MAHRHDLDKHKPYYPMILKYVHNYHMLALFEMSKDFGESTLLVSTFEEPAVVAKYTF